MALRLRRGTDAERLIMTPPEAGELIYTTDTKAVYVGDGTTVGGLPVSGSALGIDDLGNVTVTAPNDNDILKWNGTAWINVPQESLEKPGNIYGTDSTLLIDTDNSVIVGPIVTNTPIIGDVVGDFTGTLTGDVVGDVVGTLTGNVIGTLDGDMTGSVFGDDSSVIVDGLDGSIHTGNISTPRLILNNVNQPGDGLNGGIGEVNLDIVSNDNRSLLNLRRVSETDLTGDIATIYGTVTFGRTDVNGTLTTNIFFGRENGMYFGNNPTGVFDDGSYFMVWRDNKLGVGTAAPTETLDVNGNAVISGFVQFGSLTTTERDALTAANGMVIYNTTNDKFEGYQNGAWINLDDGLAAS